MELTLSETETFFLLDMPGECVAADDPNMEAVKAQLDAYDTLGAALTTGGVTSKHQPRALQVLRASLALQQKARNAHGGVGERTPSPTDGT